MDDTTHGRNRNRRAFLASAAVAGLGSLAGCTGVFDDDGNGDGNGNGENGDGNGSGDIGSIGYGREGVSFEGTSMADMPALEGELMVYSGRGEFLVGPLVDFIDEQYEDFDLEVRYAGSTDLVNDILNEGSGTPADVFYSVNAGSLGVLSDEGRTSELGDDLLEMVDESFRTGDWIGTSGRARSVPYNTNALSEGALPDSIHDYPEGVDADLGWAPSYGSCQAFVTAMRILSGEEQTREWLEAVQEAGIEPYPNEFAVCQAIADGELDAGFTNHYYIQRVVEGRNDPPIATAFTRNDAGTIFNVAGATVTDVADDPDLAENFVRHLLSTEAQNYFAVRTQEYPLVEGVPPVGDLPSIDELAVPDLDLAQLSDLEATVDLMRDVGIEI